MRSQFLPFSPPLIGQEEIDEVVDTLRSGWITSGPKTKQFEQEFTAALGAPASLALNSCTAALHVALLTLNVGPGDEVITTGWTFAATGNVIVHVGATPVFVDVEPDTLNLDPKKVMSAITPRTKAIMPVHFAGHPVDLDAIRSLAEQHRLHVIEDAAHGIGASYRGVPIGSGNNPTAFSFYATKNLVTGEGGMLTGDMEFLDDARIVSLHGMSREAWGRYTQGGSWAYDIVCPGFKYNMSDIQSSLGIWQLRKFSAMQARRREIVSAYQQAFAEVDELELPTVRAEVDHAWHLFVIRLRLQMLRIDRSQFIEEMKARNIGTSVHFIPMQKHSFYREKFGLRLEDFPVTHANSERTMSLPLNPTMSDKDVADVISAVTDITQKYRTRRIAA